MQHPRKYVLKRRKWIEKIWEMAAKNKELISQIKEVGITKEESHRQ